MNAAATISGNVIAPRELPHFPEPAIGGDSATPRITL
jgi:hypothetical protein